MKSRSIVKDDIYLEEQGSRIPGPNFSSAAKNAEQLSSNLSQERPLLLSTQNVNYKH